MELQPQPHPAALRPARHASQSSDATSSSFSTTSMSRALTGVRMVGSSSLTITNRKLARDNAVVGPLVERTG